MIWLFGIAALLLALWAFTRSRVYSRLYGDAHLLAIARALPALKHAALERIDRAVDAQDERILRTDVGLALVYTVSAKRDGFVHHLSLSFPEQGVAQGAAQMLLATVVQLLRWPASDVRLVQGNDLVQHAQWHAAREVHATWALEQVEQPLASDLRALRVRALELRTGRDWGSHEVVG